MNRARVKGRPVWNKRYGTWNFLWADADGKHRSRKLGDRLALPTREAAVKKAAALGMELRFVAPATPKVETLVNLYRAERMPVRASTVRGYELWLKNYIIPRWGNEEIHESKPGQ